MTAMFQTLTTWSGTFPGAPGYTNLHFIHSDPPSTGAQAAVDNVRTFFNSVASMIPSGITLTVSPVVKVIEATTGDLDSIISVATAPAAVAGAAAGTAWSGPVGMCVNWSTSSVHGTRVVRGRTFLVPLGSIFESGTPNDTFVATVQAAATALRTASGPTLGVWARPVEADDEHVPPIVARAGEIYPVTANFVPDKSAVLRSRRD
jgi:hypothetical protein